MAETSSYNLFWCYVHLLNRAYLMSCMPASRKCHALIRTVQVILYCGNVIEYNIIMFVFINQSVRCSQYEVA